MEPVDMVRNTHLVVAVATVPFIGGCKLSQYYYYDDGLKMNYW